jgi:hypothetical protein
MLQQEKDQKFYSAKVAFKTEVPGPKDTVKIKNVTHEYIVEAVSVTDAEATITSELQGSMDPWEVKSVRETKISEIFLNQ